MYTKEHLEIVAGVASSKQSNSKKTFKFSGILIIYPLVRHNLLLSSKTVFNDSIHFYSTGPSNNRIESGYIN